MYKFCELACTKYKESYCSHPNCPWSHFHLLLCHIPYKCYVSNAYIFAITCQKAFMFGTLVLCRVFFDSIDTEPRVLSLGGEGHS